MSKQRVTMIKVEPDAMIQKDERYGGGMYHGARLTYEQEVNGTKTTEVKGLSDVHLNKFLHLRAQLSALASSAMPVEVVLERTAQTLPDGKSFEQITSVLPKDTAINPGEEFVPKTFGGARKGGSYTANPKQTALNAASRLGGTAEEVIATARKFEEYLKETPKPATTSDVVSVTNVSSTSTPVTEQTVKYEY